MGVLWGGGIESVRQNFVQQRKSAVNVDIVICFNITESLKAHSSPIAKVVEELTILLPNWCLCAHFYKRDDYDLFNYKLITTKSVFKAFIFNSLTLNLYYKPSSGIQSAATASLRLFL